MKNLADVMIENALKAYLKKCRFKRQIKSIAKASSSRQEAIKKICDKIQVGPKEAERIYVKYTWNTNFYSE